jgi:aryl-alcohol dehydrogenase-like predicted oxidoreductase
VASRTDIRLRDQYAGQDSDTRLATLKQVAGELGITAPQLVLAWMRHHKAPVIPLIGASSVSQLNESLEALDLELDNTVMEKLA